MPKKIITKDFICLDTGVILPYGLKIITNIRKSRKPSKKLKEIKGDTILSKVASKSSFRFTTIVTRYEFVRKLNVSYSVPIETARAVYNKILEEFKISELIPNKKEINFSPDLMEKLCKCGIDLPDGLHLYISYLRKILFITSEKTEHANNMRKFYSNVKTVKEYLKSAD